MGETVNFSDMSEVRVVADRLRAMAGQPSGASLVVCTDILAGSFLQLVNRLATFENLLTAMAFDEGLHFATDEALLREVDYHLSLPEHQGLTGRVEMQAAFAELAKLFELQLVFLDKEVMLRNHQASEPRVQAPAEKKLVSLH